MTPRVSIILPTIAGREDLLAVTREAYEQTVQGEAEIIVVRERPTIGEAWNAGAAEAEGEFLLLGADDLVPFPGAVEAAIDAASEMGDSASGGIYPVPWITRPDGSTEARGSMGGGMLLGSEAPEGTVCNSSPIPFFARSAWKAAGPSIHAHYYADDYLGWRARVVGLDVRLVGAYHFQHLEGTVGRPAVQARAVADRNLYLQTVTGIHDPPEIA